MTDRYYLIEIDGDEAFLRGYIEGYFRARGLDVSGVHFGSDVGLDDERFLTRFQTFIGLKVEHNLLVMREDLLAHVQEAIARLPERWRFHVKTTREIREIRFPFRAETANREVATRIKGVLETLPGGARVEDLSVLEEQRSETFETSAYAPSHPYHLRIEGTLRGEVEATFQAYRMLQEIENVAFDDPEFTFA